MTQYLMLVLGVWACSTSVLFIKSSASDAIWLSAYRTLLAGLFLSPFFITACRKHGREHAVLALRRGLLPAAFLALHFISWMYGARMTASAHATLIVNMTPVSMPLALYLAVRERLNKAEVAGTLLALVGVLLLSIGDFRFRSEYAIGDIVCFLSMLLYTGYLALGRKNRDAPSVWLYVVPTYSVCGLICAVVGFAAWGVSPHFNPVAAFQSPSEWILVLGMVLVPTVAGHSLVNQALRTLRGQTVVVVNLGQFIFAGAMAWPLLHDYPEPAFYPAAILVIIGALIVVFKAPRDHRPAGKAAQESGTGS